MGLFEKEQPKRVTIRTGATLVCQVCGCDQFFPRKGQLNTAVMTFLNLDWTNPTADCLVCGRCGYVHWFLGSKDDD